MTQEEFIKISDSLRGKLIALARKFVSASGTELDDEDVVQEALVVLYELSEKGYPVRNAEALAVKITKNICIREYRKQKMKTEPITGDSYSGGESAETATDASDNAIIKQQLYGSLSKTERRYMEMKAGDGLSLDEISCLTGKPKPAIKTALSKAKSKMRQKMKEMGL